MARQAEGWVGRPEPQIRRIPGRRPEGKPSVSWTGWGAMLEGMQCGAGEGFKVLRHHACRLLVAVSASRSRAFPPTRRRRASSRRATRLRSPASRSAPASGSSTSRRINTPRSRAAAPPAWSSSISDGSGSGGSRGVVQGASMVPTSYASSTTSDKKADEVRMTLRAGAVKDVVGRAAADPLARPRAGDRGAPQGRDRSDERRDHPGGRQRRRARRRTPASASSRSSTAASAPTSISCSSAWIA